MPEINRERIALWVQALRSGDYKQGSSALCWVDADGSCRWCCLGVACDVAAKNGLDIETRDFEAQRYFGGACFYLPPEVQEWYGFDSQDPYLKDRKASHWNDARGYNFAQIADAVEAEFLTQPEVAPVA